MTADRDALLRKTEDVITEYANRLDQLFRQRHTMQDVEHELKRLVNELVFASPQPSPQPSAASYDESTIKARDLNAGRFDILTGAAWEEGAAPSTEIAGDGSGAKEAWDNIDSYGPSA